MGVNHQFTPLDEIMPPVMYAIIFGFPCEDSKKQFQLLQRGLSAVVQDMPFLNGEMSQEGQTHHYRRSPPVLKIPDPVGEMDLELNDMTVPGAYCPFSYEEFRNAGFPSRVLEDKTFAPLLGTATRKIMHARANFIEGGCLLTTYFSHSFTDAYGMSLIITRWAEYCKQAQEIPEGQPLDTAKMQGLPEDRNASLLEIQREVSSTEYEKLKYRPELWKLLGLDWRGSRDSTPPVAPFSHPPVSDTRMFNISAQNLQQLKRDATPIAEDVAAGGSSWVATNDALVAFIWSSVTKARYPSTPLPHIRETSFASVAIDGRKLLSVPTDHLGNVVFCCMTEIPVSLLRASETRLGTIASRIRAQVTINKERQRLRDAFSLAACIPNVTNMANAFPSWFGEDLATTSVIDLPFYNLDFGPAFGKTGKIDCFRFPKSQFQGLCTIQPRRVDGSVDITIGLELDQMERLVASEDFSRRVKFVW